MPIDTRTDRRHPIQAVAVFSIHELVPGALRMSIPDKPVKAGISDISTGGCGLDSPYLIPPDTILKIEINPAPFVDVVKKEHPGQICVLGAVKSCAMKSVGHYRLGVLFVDIKKEDVELFSSFMKMKEQRQSPRWDMSS